MSLNLEGHMDMVLRYEDRNLRDKAKKLIPMDILTQEAKEAHELSIEMGETSDYSECLFNTVLIWFKRDFFKWVNKPPCWNCGNQDQNQIQNIGISISADIDKLCGPTRIEKYICLKCRNQINFPRYNNPLRLLETRKGRCGEWANAFTFTCRCFDLDVRIVIDFLDHIWTEFYSESQKRWIHADACETSFDKPLLYEKGWGKPLDYVIAYHKYGPYDVSHRYTADWNEMSKRRKRFNEENLKLTLAQLRQNYRLNLSQNIINDLEIKEKYDEESMLKKQSKKDDETLPGRTTGSEEWRRSRQELGDTSSGTRKLERPAGTKYKKFDFIDPSEENTLNYIKRGILRASGENLPFETIEKLFDGKNETKWLDFGGGGKNGSAWFELSTRISDDPIYLKEYSITSAKDALERDPEEWELKGLVKGSESEWILLDAQKNINFNNRNERLNFEIKNNKETGFQKLKFLIYKVKNPNIANSVQISKVDFITAKL